MDSSFISLLFQQHIQSTPAGVRCAVVRALPAGAPALRHSVCTHMHALQHTHTHSFCFTSPLSRRIHRFLFFLLSLCCQLCSRCGWITVKGSDPRKDRQRPNGQFNITLFS